MLACLRNRAERTVLGAQRHAEPGNRTALDQTVEIGSWINLDQYQPSSATFFVLLEHKTWDKAELRFAYR
jgi:hypothetical protein